MHIKNYIYRLRIGIWILLLMVLLLFNSCSKNKTEKIKLEELRNFNLNFTLEETGFFHKYYNKDNEDFLTYWYDFISEQNVVFCSKAGCNHTNESCFAVKTSGCAKFLYKGDLYYTVMDTKVNKSGEAKWYTTLMRSDLGGRNTSKVAEFEGMDWLNSLVYLDKNILYLINRIDISEYDAVNNIYNFSGQRKSVLYGINIENGDISKFDIGEGWDYHAKIIGYYNENVIINSTWYDAYYNLDVFIQEKFNDENMTYSELLSQFDNSYIEEILKEYSRLQMQDFNQSIFNINLFDKKADEINLPVPLAVDHGIYYYNKLKEDGSYELTSFDILSGKEKQIFNGLAYSVNIIGDKCFIQSATSIETNDYGIDSVVFDKNTDLEYCIDLKSNKKTQIHDLNEADVKIKILYEYGKDYIIKYTLASQMDRPRIGFISKENYFNGKIDIRFID